MKVLNTGAIAALVLLSACNSKDEQKPQNPSKADEVVENQEVSPFQIPPIEGVYANQAGQVVLVDRVSFEDNPDLIHLRNMDLSSWSGDLTHEPQWRELGAFGPRFIELKKEGSQFKGQWTSYDNKNFEISARRKSNGGLEIVVSSRDVEGDFNLNLEYQKPGFKTHQMLIDSQKEMVEKVVRKFKYSRDLNLCKEKYARHSFPGELIQTGDDFPCFKYFVDQMENVSVEHFKLAYQENLPLKQLKYLAKVGKLKGNLGTYGQDLMEYASKVSGVSGIKCYDFQSETTSQLCLPSGLENEEKLELLVDLGAPVEWKNYRDEVEGVLHSEFLLSPCIVKKVLEKTKTVNNKVVFNFVKSMNGVDEFDNKEANEVFAQMIRGNKVSLREDLYEYIGFQKLGLTYLTNAGLLMELIKFAEETGYRKHYLSLHLDDMENALDGYKRESLDEEYSFKFRYEAHKKVGNLKKMIKVLNDFVGEK